MAKERVWGKYVDEVVNSIRPDSLKRLLLLRMIICREIHEEGPLSTDFLSTDDETSFDRKFETFCKKLSVSRYEELRPVAERMLTDEQLSIVFDIRDRARQDYITALYMSAKYT